LCLETQAIDEFNTETLHLAGDWTKREGWSSEGKISDILSDERLRKIGSEDRDNIISQVDSSEFKKKKKKSYPK